MLALTTNLAQYSFAKCASRRADSHFGRYWPGYLVVLSAPLICADLLRHVLQDSGMWTDGSAMFNEECCNEFAHGCHGLHGIRCLTWVGVVFTLIGTYTGFICMLVGIFNAANLPKKFRREWRNLRRASRKRV